MATTAYGPYTPAFVPTAITTGKLGHETTAFDLHFTGTPNGQAAADGIVGPNAIYEFMRQIWTPEVLEHKFNQNLLISAFNAPVEDGWMNNLATSHSARITFKKWMNPLQRVRVAKAKYLEDNSCPKQLDLNCTIPGGGPLDEYEQVDVDFRFEYSIRADVCVKNKRLYAGQVEEQYAESLQAVAYRRALDAWMALAEQIIESDSPVLIPSMVPKVGATNHLVVGMDAVDSFYTTASNVFNYLGRAFGPRFKSEFLVTIHPDLALEIEQDFSQALSYDTTGIRQDWINVDQSAFGSFNVLPSLPRWRGITVLIAPDDIAMHNGTPNGANFNPWEGTATINDTTYNTVRMIIASRRSFWTKTVQLMDKTIFPATVNNPVESMVEIWLGGDKLIYPEETFLVDFAVSQVA